MFCPPSLGTFAALTEEAGPEAAPDGSFCNSCCDVLLAHAVSPATRRYAHRIGPLPPFVGVGQTLRVLLCSWDHFGDKRSMRWALLLLVLAGCGRARIPYDFRNIETRKQARFDQRRAILPLEDRRDAREVGDGKGRFVYRGLAYKGTELDELSGKPMYAVTEALGQHLARTRVFKQVVLLRAKDQVGPGELVLSGQVRRMRGYVEAEAPDKKSKRPPTERKVLAEVLSTGFRFIKRTGWCSMAPPAGHSPKREASMKREMRPPPGTCWPRPW